MEAQPWDGKKEWAEWWHCTRDEYDNDPEFVRSSALKDYWEDPSLYESRYITGELPRKSPTRDMLLGQAVHGLVLERNLDKEWKVAGPCGAILQSGKNKDKPCGANTASNDHPPYWDTQNNIWLCGRHNNGRKFIEVPDALTSQEDRIVHTIAAKIGSDPLCADYITHRHHEKAARSIDRKTGVLKKALLDIFLPKKMKIVDIKVTGEFNEDAIWNKILRFGWGFSLAHYESVVHDVGHFLVPQISAKAGNPKRYVEQPMGWTLILAESVPPHRVAPFDIPVEAQDICRDTHRNVLLDFAQSEKTGKYPQRKLQTGMPAFFAFRHDHERVFHD